MSTPAPSPRAPRSSSTSTRSGTTSPRCASAVGGRALMAVVKADGYGHGMLEVARAAREAGADWLGVAVIEEALALRAAGDTGRVLTWLAVPGEDYRRRVAAGVDVTAYSVAELDEIARRRRGAGHAAPGSSSRSTPACPGAAPPSRTGRTWSLAAVEAERCRRGHRSPASGPTSPAATSPTTPPTTRRSRPSAGPLDARRGGRARPRGAAPVQLRRRAHPALGPVRPGPVRHRAVRALPGPRGQHVGRARAWSRR